MKENTYDVPAYKFAIIASNKLNSEYMKTHEEYEYDLLDDFNNGSVDIIPFELVDGLTLDELFKTTETNGFGFICYNQYKSNKKVYTTTYFNAVFSPDYLDGIGDTTVDKVIENYLEENYFSLKTPDQRIANCFFERYQCSSNDVSVKLEEMKVKRFLKELK